MDRRGFFKILAATAAAAIVLPEIWTPSKTIFLPPRQGWWQPPMIMREVQQYLINTNELAMRYDMAWAIEGGAAHYHVDCLPVGNPGWPNEMTPAEIIEVNRAGARSAFEDLERRHGFKRRDQRALPLPNGVNIARYV